MEAANPEVTNELARLSRENSELREELAAHKVSFGGLAFDDFVRLLHQDKLDFESKGEVKDAFQYTLRNCGVKQPFVENQEDLVGFRDVADVFAAWPAEVVKT